ncbi:putative zinc finger in N-recognin-domain-containing protein [Choanephora cucurbitarum]|nr:putative zinc finger in N-recognin-domain-containing protein [Choanephora cucurbitarum]
MSFEEEKTLTALDYIEKQEELEREAFSTLPGKFEKCTFPLGYIRQPVYACKTCSVDTVAGICYSCSIACHASHDLLELFPKRHFRCDCGLPDKLNHPCELMIPAKKIIRTNDDNQYNHNFQGRYCRCDQLYDPEKEEEVMYQCVACEDWFHQRCIGQIPESIDDFECYVCRTCTAKYPFLYHQSDSRFSFGLSKGDQPIHEWILPENMKEEDIEKENEEKVGEKRKSSETTVSVQKRQKTDPDTFPEHDHIELFLQDNWREGLCRCTQCMQAYKAHDVEFLLAEEKTYEPEEDEDTGKSLLEVGMEQLQRIGRVQVLESLMAYQDLAEDIKHYLESFQSSRKTVTKEDIEAFFEKKRHERENKN